MQPWGDEDPSCDFYDSDTPTDGPNFDEQARRTGLGEDIRYYRKIAAEVGKPVLELCCGTGRIAMPLLADGHTVTAVDASAGMLRQFRAKLDQVSADERRRATLLQADVTDVPFREEFGLVFIAFNSLVVIPSFEQQLQVLRNAFAALMPGGVFAADIPNALAMPKNASLRPALMFSRRHLTRGTRYSRFTFNDALDGDQRQRVFGYYDEIRADGTLVRYEWQRQWRLIFRFELELMLRLCGFEEITVWGNFARGTFKSNDEKIVAYARRPTETNNQLR
jgi:SAM-dependent methyltransferase